MKRLQLFAVIFCITSAFAEPFFFSTLEAITQLADRSDSLMNNLQKIREKTAIINQDIEKSAPAGVLGNLASDVINYKSNTTAGVINSATQAIDVTANDMVAWVKNMSFTCVDNGSDVLLHKFQEYAVRHNMDNMTLPPVETRIYGVQVSASGGYFSSFASLFKNKPINVTVDGDQGISIRIPLSLGIIDSGYTRFSANLFFISMSGSIKMQIQKNEIHVLLKLKATNTCALTVESVEVVTLDDISIQYESSCRYCSTMISQMSSGLANFMKATLIKEVQAGIENGIKNVLKSDSLLCAHFIKPA